MYIPWSDEIVKRCPPVLLMEWTDGEPCAEPMRLERWGHRGKPGCEIDAIGIAIDFQYVSTSPPTSRVTPWKGVIIFTSKSTSVFQLEK
jgi:hypothetical protein